MLKLHLSFNTTLSVRFRQTEPLTGQGVCREAQAFFS